MEGATLTTRLPRRQRARSPARPGRRSPPHRRRWACRIGTRGFFPRPVEARCRDSESPAAIGVPGRASLTSDVTGHPVHGASGQVCGPCARRGRDRWGRVGRRRCCVARTATAPAAR